jgi:hypothetical protein
VEKGNSLRVVDKIGSAQNTQAVAEGTTSVADVKEEQEP